MPAVQRRAAVHPELRRPGRGRRSHKLVDGERSSPGSAPDGFFVDLGAIFDLGTLRPFQQLHVVRQKLFKTEGEPVNSTDRMNVHSIALQVPLSELTAARSNRYACATGRR